MAVILIYVLFEFVGDAVAVAISAMVEHFSQPISLLVFFALFALVFWVGWLAAVRVTDSFFVSRGKT